MSVPNNGDSPESEFYESPESKPPVQTHMVLSGKFRIAAFQDGDFIRAVDDGRTLAHKLADGSWSRPVRESRQRRPGPYDDVKPKFPAVKVQLEKGIYY